MAIILSLETSASICAVALHDKGVLLASAELHIEQSHASKLASLIRDVTAVAAVDMKNLQALAVSSGPGSYTGLRIGTATAKGLCYALNIPLIAVNTLEVMARQMVGVNVYQALLCPMIDARRMEVYCMVVDAALQPVQPVEAKIVDEHSFLDLLDNHQVLFFGSGAEKCRSVITHDNARFINNIHPSVITLGVMASEKLEKNEIAELIAFEPYYLKEFTVKKPVTAEPH
ncbi:MAG TPA: tRNA (adenosine(37)-N6)-threonylcarbamoyltransferase complex dimerization subunit type 1 TsaB [Ohtaekwangia sp.]|nr:tRNA (adenosine(37)-N6)-threonylcarbamoyltransferase complex dimerization subunit type 1 TsaB [Ohtaekwangia sp.]